MCRRSSGCFKSENSMKSGLKTFLLVLGTAAGGAAQEQPQGRFLARRLEVGRPLAYALSYRHTPEQEIFFPDSTFDFSPYQYVGFHYFPTRTDARGSLDSVVYELISFETDSLQSLHLPVYVRQARGDCTRVYARPDTLRLHRPAGSRHLQLDLRQQPLQRQPNYPLFVLAGLVGFLILGILNIFFGKDLWQAGRRLRLWRRHIEFTAAFRRLSRPVTERRQLTANMERAISIWKTYMERLTGTPFTTFTTREIIQQFPDEDALAEGLREADAFVYGGMGTFQVQNVLDRLQAVALHTYAARQALLRQDAVPPASDLP